MPSPPALSAFPALTFGVNPWENLLCVGDGEVPAAVGRTHYPPLPEPSCAPTSPAYLVPQNISFPPEKAQTHL